MRNFSILFAALVMTIAMSGCTTLLNEQAAAAAKDAENIARGCPAAAEKAAECRKAVEAMDKLQQSWLLFQADAESIADVRRELANLQSRKDFNDRQRETDSYRADVNIITDPHDASEYDADARALAEYDREVLSGLSTPPDQLTRCSSAADCREKAAQVRLAHQHVDELNNQRDLIDYEIREAETRLHGLIMGYKQLYFEITGSSELPLSSGWGEISQETAMADRVPKLVQQRMTELNETVQQARAEAQRIAAEQCGEGAALKDAPPKPSPPSGDYPQDILNSQGMGLPGGPAPLACPASCAGITQAWCSSNCSVFIGPQCSLCPTCAAQGCP